MEKITTFPIDKREEMAAFIEEVRSIYDDEKRERKTGHFLNSNFNPDDLTWEDRLIWDKVKDKTITRSDFNAYKESIIDPVTRGARSDIPASRYAFFVFIGNKATPLLSR